MSSNRKATIIAGTLYFIVIIAGILSIAPAIDDSDYLLKAAANPHQVLLAALFQFIMTIANLGFAITLYPILKIFNEGLAIGFLSFRIIASVFNSIGCIILLLLLALSREFVCAEVPDSSIYQTLGNVLRAGRDFVNHIAMVFTLSVGGLMFYYLLYQTKLIPRWLSVWCLIGTLFTISSSLLIMFHAIDIITTIYIALNLPLVLLELVLAVWFIAKGFDSNVINLIAEKNENK